jgi:putative transposase
VIQSAFYIDFLPYKARQSDEMGSEFNIVYSHGTLATYINDGKKRVVKYDPCEVSWVYLLEAGGSYLDIPYRDLSHGAVSVAEIQNRARSLRNELSNGRPLFAGAVSPNSRRT